MYAKRILQTRACLFCIPFSARKLVLTGIPVFFSWQTERNFQEITRFSVTVKKAVDRSKIVSLFKCHTYTFQTQTELIWYLVWFRCDWSKTFVLYCVYVYPYISCYMLYLQLFIGLHSGFDINEISVIFIIVFGYCHHDHWQQKHLGGSNSKIFLIDRLPWVGHIFILADSYR